jgi:hypothetical protein
MSKKQQEKRAMILSQDEVQTLKNLIESAKVTVLHSIKGSVTGNEIKELETALNTFGRATTWENEKVLKPKVDY